MKIDILFLLIGLFVGFFLVYVTSPAPKIILKYPTLDNINSTTYVDEAGKCYRYYAKETSCKNSTDK